MDINILEQAILNAPFGYAYHKVLLDDCGEVVDYIFLAVNPAFEEMTGLRKEDILNKKVTEVLPGIREGNYDWVDFYGKVAMNEEKQEFTQFAEPLNRWYKVSAYAPSKGYFVTIFQEISYEIQLIDDLKAQKQKIMELSGELKIIFNGTQDAVFLVEVENNEFRYIRNNSTHQQLTGFDSSFIFNKTPVELVGRKIGEKVQVNYQKCVDTKESIIYEERLNLPGGERTWLTSLTPIMEKGKVQYLVGSSKDVTLQKMAEEQLAKRLKYEKIVSNISKLALKGSNNKCFLMETLRLIGQGIEVSRACLFETQGQIGTINNTYKWSASSLESQKENLDTIPEEKLAWWTNLIKNREVIKYSNIEDIPDEVTKEILRKRNIKSILVFPIYVEDRFWGFLKFDECLQVRKWEDDLIILRLVVDIISKYILRKIQEEKLWQENQRYRALVNSTQDIIYELDVNQRHKAIFGRWLEKEGLEPEFFLGKNATELYGEQWAAIHEEANIKTLSGQNVVYDWNIEINNNLRHYQTSLSPIRNKNGEVSGIVGIGREITSLIELQHNLREEKKLIDITFESIGDGVVVTDKKGNIKKMNKVAQEITRWSLNEAMGKLFSEVFILINENTKQEVENPITKVLKSGKVVGLANHTILITKDGQHIPISDSAAPIKDEKGILYGVVMVFRDVTKEKKYQKKILHMSKHDALTGLYNRRAIVEELEKVEASKQLPLSIIMGDVNGLRLTNDAFGHETGDKLLLKAAEMIKESCRKEDIIARWGGDEFLILLPNTSDEIPEKVIKRIKRKCIENSTGNIQLSISLGYAIKKETDISIKQILKEAEELMYREKLIQGKSYRNNIINTMMTTLNEKSHETMEHVERLIEYSRKLGNKIGLSSKEMDELVLLATLHDIGKVSINENILNSPIQLTFEEWKEMKKHPEIGFRIVQNIPELSSVAQYILSHHERWDGKGYPQGLEKEEIPILSRVLSVVDAFDAMTNDRIYRNSMSKEDALREIRSNAGTQFDPQIVEAFLELFE